MLSHPLADPRNQIGDDSSTNPRIEVKLLIEVVIEIARETWRLQRTMARNSGMDVTLNDELGASLSRISDSLASAHIEVVESTGQNHDAGSRYKVSHVEEGEGDLFVSETLIPAVRVAGQQVSPATVILGHRGGQS